MQTTGINLLRSVSGHAIERSKMTAYVRLLGWISISVLLAVGLISFVIFLFVQNSLSQAKEKEAVLTQQLQELVGVEGLHAIVENRLSLISRVLDIQDNYSKTLNLISRSSSDSGIIAFSVDGESDAVAIKYTPRTIPEANELIGNLFRMSQEKLITSATLNSIVLGSDGNVNLVVSFFSI